MTVSRLRQELTDQELTMYAAYYSVKAALEEEAIRKQRNNQRYN